MILDKEVVNVVSAVVLSVILCWLQ